MAQYIRAQVALDRKDYATVVDAYNDVIAKYPSLIKAEDYGMLASKVADVNATRDRGNGKRNYCGGAFNAENNAFYNITKNPEAIFSTIGGSNQCWTVRGLNNLKNSESGYMQVDADIVNALSDADVRKAVVTKEATPDFWTYSVASGDTTWYSYPMPAYTSMKFAATEGRDRGNYAWVGWGVEDIFDPALKVTMGTGAERLVSESRYFCGFSIVKKGYATGSYTTIYQLNYNNIWSYGPTGGAYFEKQ